MCVCVLCSSLTLSGEEGMGGEVWMQFGKGGGRREGCGGVGERSVAGRWPAAQERWSHVCLSRAETAGAIWCG